jgi:electron transport complex protein RnfG
MSGKHELSAKGSEPSSVRLVATLGFAGLLSGLIIVSVFEATLPTITAYKAKVLQEAVFTVLPGVSSMQRLTYRDGSMVVAVGDEQEEDVVFGGYDADGKLIGYAVPSAGPGFQDTIRLLYGYLPQDRKVVGMEILQSRETPGLGDKIYKDAAFVANFSALSIDPEIITVKKGAKTALNEVDAITGATISSKAVVQIINRGNQRWVPRFDGSGVLSRPPPAGGE